MSLKTCERLQQSLTLLDSWIAANRPSSSKSQEIFTAFMERYGSGLVGNEEFVTKTKRVIEKASRLAAGVTIMERLLSTEKELILKETPQNEIEINGSPSYFSSPSSLMLNFDHPKILYISLNDLGERAATYRLPHSVVFIHECLHAWHEFTNSDRSNKSSCLPEMDSQEEELTITGCIQGTSEIIDCCCEHSALRELNLPPRISHRGFSTELPKWDDWVEHRIFSKMLELSQSGQVDSHQMDIALELALDSYLLESHPETMEEWLQIASFLPQAGGRSEYALTIAILLNSRKLMALLLQAGANLTDQMLSYATQTCDQRYDVTWRMLKQKKLSISSSGYQEDSNLQAILKAKFFYDGTLPIHTLKELFALYPTWFWTKANFSDTLGITDLAKNKEIFTSWTQSHHYSKPEHATFEFRVDGACVPSRGYRFTIFPECHKFKKDFGVELSTPYFTSMEREYFIKTASISHIEPLVDSLSKAILKEFSPASLGRAHYQQFFRTLNHLIATRIRTASFLPVVSSEKAEFSSTSLTSYYDIPIISEEGDGLLQQMKDDFNEWHPNLIQSLKDKNGKPVAFASCRIALFENNDPRSYLLQMKPFGIFVNDLFFSLEI